MELKSLTLLAVAALAVAGCDSDSNSDSSDLGLHEDIRVLEFVQQRCWGMTCSRQ